MKRILAILLSAAMCMTVLSGCRRNNMDNNQTTTPPATENNNSAMPESSKPENDTTENETDKENPSDTMGDMVDDMMSSDKLKADATLEDIIMDLGTELGITMPTKLDDANLKDVFGIQPEWIEEYYGEYSAANTSADHLLAFKVKKGHINDVKKALEERRTAITTGFEQSLLEELEKARNATIVEKGNYLFFVIAGDVQNAADKEVNRAKEIIDSYFE